ncbi:(2Fe-2S)-binding protein [Falsiroseomonas tokyonensis]|uniref:(2Fe-2S)-binding protein n=1 Tax=Falsiroseomonas tokyonensis TaxID=430521 RepID=A0ABV7C0V9_9PROT|nr:(2Fe-2S)-binding protein [Falsiroseomonas tokyonensis]MBU8541322.1 (2Fe-2S)-binding protein [Falsiroseomonas tokyonensis]
MFRRTDPPDCTIVWEGRELPARAGESLAVALLAAGITTFRETPVTGAARGPLCLMGACFDCLVQVEEAQNMQACLVPVTPGLRAQMQHGARGFVEDAA